MLETRLNEWIKKVLEAYEVGRAEVMVDTYKMLLEADKIISEEFGFAPVFKENEG